MPLELLKYHNVNQVQFGRDPSSVYLRPYLCAVHKGVQEMWFCQMNIVIMACNTDLRLFLLKYIILAIATYNRYSVAQRRNVCVEYCENADIFTEILK